MESVDILLATYKPNLFYFEELLSSLNQQTYNNIKIIVRDDSDDKNEYDKVVSLVKKHITKFDFKIYRNEKNYGSNRTFELLTIESESEFLAYCDQDDYWEYNKIEKLVEEMIKKEGVLCYSDLSVIDAESNLTSTSFKKMHKRLKHQKGDGLFSYLLRRNSVTGCTMLIKADIAKQALPFCIDYYVHDHWLALYASTKGKIVYINKPLIRYRIHGKNQIGASILNNINSKDDYIREKILFEKEKFEYLLSNDIFGTRESIIIQDTLNWTNERLSFFNNLNFHTTLTMLKKITDDYQLIGFEILIRVLPSKYSSKLIEIVKK